MVPSRQAGGLHAAANPRRLRDKTRDWASHRKYKSEVLQGGVGPALLSSLKDPSC